MTSPAFRTLVAIIALLSLPVAVIPQQKKTPEPNRTPQLVRTTSRHELRRLPYGSTFTLVGPPDGSIIIEGWPRSEVDISAEIQLRADTEADLTLLAAVNTFVVDDDTNHVRVLSTGTHDKAFMRSVAKKFPKTLLGLPWRIDYRIRVPLLTDLEISGGRGPISISGVEGNIRVSAAESVTNLTVIGGTLSATIGTGKVNLEIPVRSWRGVGAEVRVVTGELTIGLAPGFNGDINADVLRLGHIEDAYGALQPRQTRGASGPNQIRATAGAGGPSFQFTVGDGTIVIKKAEEANSKQ
jgi:hypothetical protein